MESITRLHFSFMTTQKEQIKYAIEYATKKRDSYDRIINQYREICDHSDCDVTEKASGCFTNAQYTTTCLICGLVHVIEYKKK